MVRRNKDTKREGKTENCLLLLCLHGSEELHWVGICKELLGNGKYPAFPAVSSNSLLPFCPLQLFVA